MLDPSRYWLLREADVKVREPPDKAEGTHSIRLEYQDSDGLPVPTRCVIHVDAQVTGPAAGLSGQDQVHDDLVWEFDFHRLANASERDFTLSAFGIPEPIRPAASRWRRGTRLLVLIALGTVLLVVGILLRRRFSHREANPRA